MTEPKPIREKIRETSADGSHLREDTPDEPGLPQAVNLEREHPVSSAARRRDEFRPGEEIPERARAAEESARRVAHHEDEGA